MLDSRQLDPEVHSRSDGDRTTDTFMPIALCIRTLATHADSCQIALLFMRGRRLEFQNDSQELIYHDLVFSLIDLVKFKHLGQKLLTQALTIVDL